MNPNPLDIINAQRRRHRWITCALMLVSLTAFTTLIAYAIAPR